MISNKTIILKKALRHTPCALFIILTLSAQSY